MFGDTSERMLAAEAKANAPAHRPATCGAAAASDERLGVGTANDCVSAVNGRPTACRHLSSAGEARQRTPAFCEDCLADGTDWVSLRVCLTCGHVSCAEGSPSDHSAQHYAETDHPIAASVGSQPSSRWCYPDARSV